MWQAGLTELRSSSLHKEHSYQTTSQVLSKVFVTRLHMYMCACHGMHVDTRGQLVEFVLSFYHVGPGDHQAW